MILTLSLRPISSQRTVFEKDRQWPRLRLTANPSAFTMLKEKLSNRVIYNTLAFNYTLESNNITEYNNNC